MSAPLRLTAFAVALSAVFGLSFGIGRVTGEPAAPRDELHEERGEGGDRPAGGDHADGGEGGDH